MPIFYNRVNRISNPSDKNSARKWYPVVKSISLASEKEMGTIIADETTLNRKEAEMAIAQAAKAILILLKAGRTVRLGDWATISVTVASEGADTEAECTPAKIKSVRPHCRFSKEFVTELQKAEFQYTKSLEKKSSKSSSSSDGEGEDPGPGIVTE